ncbi:aryl-sulfate sulfotransferase, partial [Chloroflexota bacterium]
LDWNSNVVWRYENLYINSHDWVRMENGNTLIAHWIPIPDDIAAKVKGGIPGSERDGVMWDDCLREIAPDGKVEWEWIAYEHLDLDTDIMCPVCPRVTWSYVNSLVTLPDGNILTSLRQINTIAIINRDTGEFKWRWGLGELGHQHNPTLLNNGNILVFDNGTHRQCYDSDMVYSRVLEINPKTNKIEWEYRDENELLFYSPICSGAQRLPNGNTLICEATKGRIFEVTPKKELAWEFFNPFYDYYRPGILGLTNITYRAYRYGADYEGLQGKTLDPDRFEWAFQKKDTVS